MTRSKTTEKIATSGQWAACSMSFGKHLRSSKFMLLTNKNRNISLSIFYNYLMIYLYVICAISMLKRAFKSSYDVIAVSRNDGPIPEIKVTSNNGEDWKYFKEACTTFIFVFKTIESN